MDECSNSVDVCHASFLTRMTDPEKSLVIMKDFEDELQVAHSPLCDLPKKRRNQDQVHSPKTHVTVWTSDIRTDILETTGFPS